MLYIVAGLLTALVVAGLLHPLLRQRRETESRSAEELEVYKAQLADIERDLAAGTLAAEEAAAARREVEHRILAADSERRRRVTQGRPAKRLALVLLIVLPIAGPGLYLLLGNPDMPARPHAERQDVAMQRALQQRAAEMREALAEKPDDPDGWRELALLRTMLGQSGAAIAAYRQAIAQGAEDAQVYSALAEALIIQASGQVNREARQALAEALKRDERDPLALYYIGHALEQDGRYETALSLWQDMVAALPEDSTWRQRLQRDIARVKAQMATEKQ